MPDNTERVTAETQEKAAETSELVENASQEVEQAASTAPTAPIEEALKGIALALTEIRTELKKLDIKDAEQEAEQTDKAVVTTPAPAFRFVRRNGRRIKREVKV